MSTKNKAYNFEDEVIGFSAAILDGMNDGEIESHFASVEEYVDEDGSKHEYYIIDVIVK